VCKRGGGVAFRSTKTTPGSSPWRNVLSMLRIWNSTNGLGIRHNQVCRLPARLFDASTSHHRLPSPVSPSPNPKPNCERSEPSSCVTVSTGKRLHLQGAEGGAAKDTNG
jgi:hypothetical protein